MSGKWGKWNVIVFTLALLPAAAAQLPTSARNVFRSFYSYLQNEFVIFFLTFLLFFMLFYSIYAALAQRLKIFQSEHGGHATLSKPGKTFCVAISLLTCFSLFYMTRGRPMRQMLEDFLGPFGVFGGVVLALMTFLFVYTGFHNDIHRGWAATLALFLAGLALVMFGWYLAYDNIMHIGWGIATVAIIAGAIGSLIHSRRHAGEQTAEHEGAGGAGGGAGGPHAGDEPGQVGLVGNPIAQDGAATVRWVPRPANEQVTHYQIEYAWNIAGPMTWQRHHTDAGLGFDVPNQPTVRAFTVPGLHNDRDYRFRIRAINAHGEGAWSYPGFCRPQAALPQDPLQGPPQIVYNQANDEVEQILVDTN